MKTAALISALVVITNFAANASSNALVGGKIDGKYGLEAWGAVSPFQPKKKLTYKSGNLLGGGTGSGGKLTIEVYIERTR